MPRNNSASLAILMLKILEAKKKVQFGNIGTKQKNLENVVNFISGVINESLRQLEGPDDVQEGTFG